MAKRNVGIKKVGSARTVFLTAKSARFLVGTGKYQYAAVEPLLGTLPRDVPLLDVPSDPPLPEVQSEPTEPESAEEEQEAEPEPEEQDEEAGEQEEGDEDAPRLTKSGKPDRRYKRRDMQAEE